MHINGISKITLLDIPGYVGATVFTGGCNFRCPFCHNASLVLDTASAPEYDENDVLALLKKRKGLLDAICITGGEPLLQSDIKDSMSRLKDMGYFVKLDTNGSMPDRLEEIVNENLVDYIAMDIKNSPEKYAVTAGLNFVDIGKIKRSIDIIMNRVKIYEFRTTVVKEYHSASDFEAIGKLICGADKYFLQKFEDSGNIIAKENSILHSASDDEMNEFRALALKYVKSCEIRG